MDPSSHLFQTCLVLVTPSLLHVIVQNFISPPPSSPNYLLQNSKLCNLRIYHLYQIPVLQTILSYLIKVAHLKVTLQIVQVIIQALHSVGSVYHCNQEKKKIQPGKRTLNTRNQVNLIKKLFGEMEGLAMNQKKIFI